MNAPEPKLLRIRAVLERVPLSKGTLYKMMARGEFPRPVRLGGIAVWRTVDVEAWLDSL